MEQQESNKLIAEFMGNNVFERPGGDTWLHYETQHGDWIPWCELGQAEYHSNWEWLMRVVEKIEGLGYHVTIYKHYASITSETDSDFIIIPPHGSELDKLSATHGVISIFITWYNQSLTSDKK